MTPIRVACGPDRRPGSPSEHRGQARASGAATRAALDVRGWTAAADRTTQERTTQERTTPERPDRERPSQDPVSGGWTADAAVSALFAAQYRPLVRLAGLLLHDTALAEDVVQDAFVGLHQRWRRLRDPDAGVAYLRRSVVNGCRSAMRHRGVVDRYLSSQAPPRAGAGAETFAEQAETHAELLAAVRELPERQRVALVLRYYLDLSEVQTAEIMGVSLGAVKSHTFRALTALRRFLEPRP